MTVKLVRLPMLALLATAVVLPTTLLFGRTTGAIPGINGIPPNATTGFPSCGACHGSGSPGERGPVTVSFTGSAAIQSGQTASFGLSISSAVPGNLGGFALTTTQGGFTAQGNTQTGNAGKALTHTNNSSRSWTFQYSSAQTGLVQWNAAANTVDGNGKNSNDSWGWYGRDPSVPGTPFRVFVSDSQVFPYGKACQGTSGLVPLLGAAKNATLGQAFPVEIYNLEPASIAVGSFGFSDKSFGALPLPLPLDAFGAKGCQLDASLDILLPVPTTGSGSGNGQAVFQWFIPNIPVLKGLPIFLSALVVDKVNALGLVTAGALKAVVQ